MVGYDTSERLLARRAFRPAGNSRRFWLRVEEDDPFPWCGGGPVRRRTSWRRCPRARVPRRVRRRLAGAVEPPSKASARTRPAEGSNLPETRTAPTPKPPTPKPPTPKASGAQAASACTPAASAGRSGQPASAAIVNQPTSANAPAVPVQRRLVNRGWEDRERGAGRGRAGAGGDRFRRCCRPGRSTRSCRFSASWPAPSSCSGRGGSRRRPSSRRWSRSARPRVPPSARRRPARRHHRRRSRKRRRSRSPGRRLGPRRPRR